MMLVFFGSLQSLKEAKLNHLFVRSQLLSSFGKKT